MILIDLKLSQQNKNSGKVEQTKQVKKETMAELFNPKPIIKTIIENTKTNSTVVNGFWIVLQDWSQCDRACGGGKSTLQRICSPPRNGGTPCIGEPILTKPCNEHPCPLQMSNNQSNSNKTLVTLQPVVKVLQFSTRPQRYSKCVIKESDLMLLKPQIENKVENPVTQNGIDREFIEIPTRTVMNNRTITIFGGEDYSTMLEVFTLKYTKFLKSKKRGNCFILTQDKKKVELCQLGNSNQNSISEWDYDFNLFKNQCSKTNDLLQIDEKQIEMKYEQKLVNCINTE